MYVRLHRQKQRGKVYTSVQVCESYRDPERGNAPRNRVLVNFGPVDKLGPETLRNLAEGFSRAAGGPGGAAPMAKGEAGSAALLSARDFGHVYAVGKVWDRLGLSEALRQAGINGEADFEPSEQVRLLTVNRLCEPCSKWALLDWLDGVWWSGTTKPSYHHLLRAMDRLFEVKQAAEPLIANRLLGERAAVDLVFYDITSTYFEGDRSLGEQDVRRFGYSRDGRRDKRQVVIGMVMTREGIPLCHHVFSGNTVDKTTVAEVTRDLKERFRLERVVFVGDRGMLSDGNLKTLLDVALGFIVAHPLRRNVHAREVIGALSAQFNRRGQDEQFFEDVREEVRFVVAYSPTMAQEVREARHRRLRQADDWIEEQLTKLRSPAARGRKPTAQGTYDRIRDHLRDHGLLGFYDVTLSKGTVAVAKDRKALLWEAKIDGVLLLETTDLTLSPEEVVRRYKELAEIERGWRCLKSTLLVRPVHHWTERRIRAHVFVCVLALQVERWMRNRLRPLEISVPKALDALRRIKVGELETGGTTTLVLTRPTQDQAALLHALGVPPIPSTL
jgi:transposase